MSRSTSRVLAPVLAVLATVFVGDAFALPHVVHHDAVKHCRYVGSVHGSSGYGKHQDWKSLAKHRALVKAEKLGATHVVLHNLKHTGTWNGSVDGKAYACHAHHHHPKQ